MIDKIIVAKCGVVSFAIIAAALAVFALKRRRDRVKGISPRHQKVEQLSMQTIIDWAQANKKEGGSLWALLMTPAVIAKFNKKCPQIKLKPADFPLGKAGECLSLIAVDANRRITSSEDVLFLEYNTADDGAKDFLATLGRQGGIVEIKLS